jgi:hypothetical protein
MSRPSSVFEGSEFDYFSQLDDGDVSHLLSLIKRPMCNVTLSYTPPPQLPPEIRHPRPAIIASTAFITNSGRPPRPLRRSANYAIGATRNYGLGPSTSSPPILAIHCGVLLTQISKSAIAFPPLPPADVDHLVPEYGWVEFPYQVFGQAADVGQTQRRVIANMLVDMRKRDWYPSVLDHG